MLNEVIPNKTINDFNNVTPFNRFLRLTLNKDLSSYLCHKEVKTTINNKVEKLFIFILKNEIILTTNKEDEMTEEMYYVYSLENKIVQHFDMKSVYFTEVDVANDMRNLNIKFMITDFSKLTDLVLHFNSVVDLYTIFHFIQKQKMLTWQIFFEKNIPISSPYYYQKHFFLQKVNKRGKQQSRVLVFTNKFILNVSFQLASSKNAQLFEIEKTKWALSIESIKSISVLKKSPLTLKMNIDKTINKEIVEASHLKLKNKKERKFLFYYEADIIQFIFTCRRIFHNLKNKFLIVNNE